MEHGHDSIRRAHRRLRSCPEAAMIPRSAHCSPHCPGTSEDDRPRAIEDLLDLPPKWNPRPPARPLRRFVAHATTASPLQGPPAVNHLLAWRMPTRLDRGNQRAGLSPPVALSSRETRAESPCNGLRSGWSRLSGRRSRRMVSNDEHGRLTLHRKVARRHPARG